MDLIDKSLDNDYYDALYEENDSQYGDKSFTEYIANLFNILKPMIYDFY